MTESIIAMIVVFAILAATGQIVVARQRAEEAARIAAEERRIQMIRQDPEGYEKFRAWEESEAAKKKAAQEKQTAMYDMILRTGLDAANIVLKKRQ